MNEHANTLNAPTLNQIKWHNSTVVPNVYKLLTYKVQ